MKLKAIRIVQKDKPLYLTALTAEQLRKYGKIDRWSKETKKGYQRFLDWRRLGTGLRQAARYLTEEEGLFPTSILVNIRKVKEVQFQTESRIDGFGDIGELTIPDELWIVDGQHRHGALEQVMTKDSAFKNYPVPVTIMTLTNPAYPYPYDEMRMFYVVNSRQRGVPTDYAQRFLYEMLKQEGRIGLLAKEGKRALLTAAALKAADLVIEDPNSLWHKKVQMPDEVEGEMHVIRQRPLVDSITYVLKETTFAGMPEEQVSKLLNQYWQAIKTVFPEPFEDPKSYSLQATPGTYAFNMLFPAIYARCVSEGERATADKMAEVLRKIRPKGSPLDDSTFWNKEKTKNPLAVGTSMKSIRDLYEFLLETLSKA